MHVTEFQRHKRRSALLAASGPSFGPAGATRHGASVCHGGCSTDETTTVAAEAERGCPDEELMVPTIDFSGFSWQVKESSTTVGPGPNRFSAENVTTDAEGLHLRIAKRGAQWTCAEVIAQGEFGYGTYTWVVASDLARLDRNAVVGMFTWSHLPDHAHREIDIEFSQWGGTRRPGRGAFTVQPAGVGRSFDFAITHERPSRHTMSWARGRVAFSSSAGAGPTTWSYTADDVPRAGGAVAPRINLWLFRGIAPVAAQGITVTSFAYTAARRID